MKQFFYLTIVTLGVLTPTAAWGMEKSPQPSTQYDLALAMALSVEGLRPAVLERTSGVKFISLKRKSPADVGQESKRTEEKQQPPLKKAKTAQQTALDALVQKPAVQKLLEGILAFGDQKAQADMIECLQDEQQEMVAGVEREMAEAVEAARKAKIAALTPEQIQAALHQKNLVGHVKFIKKYGAEQEHHDLIFYMLSKNIPIDSVVSCLRNFLLNPQAKMAQGTKGIHEFIHRQIKEHITFIKKYTDTPDRVIHSKEEQQWFRYRAYYDALSDITTTCYADVCALPLSINAPIAFQNLPLPAQATVDTMAKIETAEATAGAGAPVAQTLAAAPPSSSLDESDEDEGDDDDDDELPGTQELDDDDGLEII